MYRLSNRRYARACEHGSAECNPLPGTAHASPAVPEGALCIATGLAVGSVGRRGSRPQPRIQDRTEPGGACHRWGTDCRFCQRQGLGRSGSTRGELEKSTTEPPNSMIALHSQKARRVAAQSKSTRLFYTGNNDLSSQLTGQVGFEQRPSFRECRRLRSETQLGGASSRWC
jgi:hypothetical protein